MVISSWRKPVKGGGTTTTPVQNNVIHIWRAYNIHFSLKILSKKCLFRLMWRSLFVLLLYWIALNCTDVPVIVSILCKSKSHSGHNRPSHPPLPRFETLDWFRRACPCQLASTTLKCTVSQHTHTQIHTHTHSHTHMYTHEEIVYVCAGGVGVVLRARDR